MASQPTGLIANKGLELLTWTTPNGHKASIFLEELKETYGIDYVFQGIDINKNTQKEEWFTKLGPNGRIPVLVDHDNGGFPVQEGWAILSYLARTYDKDHKFSFTDPLDISRAEQWGTWAQSGIGPMQGQANHFVRYAKERIPYPTQRYVGETERLYGVLDKHLAADGGREYVVGAGAGKYSIADITLFGWVNFSANASVDLAQFPALEAWWARIEARPAVQKGTAVPKGPNQIVNRRHAERMKEEEEFNKKENGFFDLVAKAKEQYDYKYKSP